MKVKVNLTYLIRKEQDVELYLVKKEEIVMQALNVNVIVDFQVCIANLQLNSKLKLMNNNNSL